MLRLIVAMAVLLGMAVAAEAQCVGRVCQVVPCGLWRPLW